jgi:23S rRNA pseudouridine2457 synthase
MSNSKKLLYYKLHKPFGYLSQFTQESPGQLTLADLFKGSNDVYPIGRLDKDSEGLLLLSNDKALVDKLLSPKNKSKYYYVQVDGAISDEAIKKLRNGVEIRINKQVYQTLPSIAARLENAPILPERDPPVRFRKDIPTSWISIQLIEGKNRQIRRMCAAVGFPVLRIFRYKIGGIEIGDLPQAMHLPLSDEEIRRLLSS